MARQQLLKARQSGDWDTALLVADEQLAAKPSDPKLLRIKFDAFVKLGREDAARSTLDDLYAAIEGNARALNNLAWALLTEDRYAGRYDDQALRFAKRSNELTHHKIWAYVDTLAVAMFRAGDRDEAIELEQRAIGLCQASGGRGVDSLKETLARFREPGDE
jgi:tetratricopeptide (TPR) repeat protein